MGRRTATEVELCIATLIGSTALGAPAREGARREIPGTMPRAVRQ